MRKTLTAAVALALASTGFSASPAMAREAMLGEVMTVGFNFCPRGWAIAEGQLLAIAQHQAVFSLLGTSYGGDGRTTFALPDLRGRTVVGMGKEPGAQTTYTWGSGRSGVNVTPSTNSSTPSAELPGSVGMTVCIALQGIFPSRY